VYGATLLPTGERKIPTFATMVAPIEEREAERGAEVQPKYRVAMEVVEVREKELERTKREVVTGKAEMDEVESARFRLEDARANVPTPLRTRRRRHADGCRKLPGFSSGNNGGKSGNRLS